MSRATIRQSYRFFLLAACTLISFGNLNGQSIANLEGVVPKQKQAIALDYISEGAGASHTLGFFFFDIDTDKDGTPDFLEIASADDLDGDGLSNGVDPDDDNDGIPDGADTQPGGINSMPGSYFRNGTNAEASGATPGDYWQYVPNSLITTGKYAGYFEHPGAYLYVDNDMDSIPDVLEYSTNDFPPFALDTGHFVNHVLLGPFPTLLGDWLYSGSPGSVDKIKYHTLGKTIFYLCDDDGGSSPSSSYSSNSPYFPEINDISGARNNQVDYNIYGTSDPNSPKIPTEVFGTDMEGLDYFRYRWFENQINEKREIVFFVTTYWNSGGSATNTFYSIPELNQMGPPFSTNRNGATTGDEFGGWVGQNDWYPHFQNTSDHDALAAGVFGAGTTWAMIASAPTNGTSPVAINPANQPWVDLYENWREDRQIIQYSAVSDILNNAPTGTTARFLARYGYDITTDNQNIIIRAGNGKNPAFLISEMEGDTNSYFIGVEDIVGDRDYDDVTFYFTFFAGVQMAGFLESYYEVGQCFDTISYVATFRNSGTADATSVIFDLTPDANSSLVVGSVQTSQGSVSIGNTVGDVAVQVNAGTIAPGDSVKVRFRVGFNQAIYPGVNTLSTQGSISGSNFTTILTTDRNGTTSFAPTVTSLDSILIMPITGPADTSLALGNSCDLNLPDFRGQVSVDNFCPPLTLVQTPAPGSSITAFTPININVQDNNGRANNWNFNVTPFDTVPPNVIVKNITLPIGPGGFTVITPDSIDNGTNDNCGPFSRTVSQDTFRCTDLGANGVYLIAVDTAGNRDSAMATVTVIDMEVPVVVTQNINAYLGVAGNVVITPAMVNNGSTDNCGIASLSLSTNFFTCGNIGPNNVTLTVTDVNGLSNSGSAIVTVIDSIKPTVSTSNVTAYLNNVGIANVTPVDIDNGSSDNCGILALSLSKSFFNCGDTGINTVYLTITDINGNIDSASAIVTVVDTVSPTVNTTSVSVPLGAGGTVTVSPMVINNFSFDNCGIDSMQLVPNTFTCADVGPNPVVLTVYDVSGNSKSGNAIITIQDTTSPNVVTQNITVYLNTGGTVSITPADVNNGTSDPCGIASLSLSQNTFNCGDLGPNTVTLVATDNNSNTKGGTAIVTVLDTISPNAMAQNRTVYLNPAGFVVVSPGLIDNGSNDACGIDSLALVPDTFRCANIGPNNVSLLAFDASGNSDAAPATITVLDTVSPNAIAQNITVYLDPTGNVTVNPALVNNGSTDACGIASFAISPNTFNCANVGPNGVTLTVTDNNGNSDMATATVTVLDTVGANVMTQNITVYLNALGNVSIVPADVNNGTVDACGISGLSLSQNNFDCSHIGANTVTLTATDNNSNVSTGTAIVTVLDTVSPMASGQNITLYLDPSGMVALDPALVDNGSTDACGIDSLAVTVDTFFCPDVGPNSIDLVAFDASGNSDNASITATVLDTVDPVVITQNINLYLDASGNATLGPAQIDNGSNDACGISALGVSPNSFGCGDLGPNGVTLTVTDNNGNSKTGNATVTVIDTVGATVVTQNITIYLDASGNASIVAADIDNGSSDACGTVSLSAAPTAFTCADIGPNNVVLTVTDGSSNSRNGNAIVTVLDTISPTASSQNLTVYLDAGGNATITAAMLDNGSSDACGIASLTADQSSFDCSDLGPNSITLTATDNNGNSDQSISTVTVLDTISPIVSAQNINLYLDASGNATLAPGLVDNGSSDACGISARSVWPNSFSCSDVGPNGVTLTVTDNNGNPKSGTAVVTVVDTVSPTVITQGVNVPLDANGIAVINASAINNGSNDACGIASITSDPDTFTCLETGPQTVTLFVTDVNGNTGTAQETVIIIETVPPIAVAQNINAYLDASGKVTITGAEIDGGSSDNCALGPMVAKPDSFDCSNIGPNNVWLVVSDLFGSKDSALSTVTVFDTIGPTVNTQPAVLFLDGTGNAVLSPWQVDNGSSDVCGIATRSVFPNTFSCADTGSNTVVLTVTDIYGNSRSSSEVVIVRDTIDPVPQTRNIDAYLNFSGLVTVDADSVDNGSSDECGISSKLLNPSSFNCSMVGPNSVLLFVSDPSGNIAAQSAIINVIDTFPPIVFTQNHTAYLDASGQVTIQGSDVDGGSVDVCGVDTLTVSPNTFNCGNIGLNSVTLTVTDLSGNTNTGPASVTVLDTVSPQVITQNISIYLDQNGLAILTPGMIDNGSIEACGIASSSLDIDSFFCSDIGPNTVTLSITDVHGNMGSGTATVTVLDTVSPSLSTQNLTVYLDNSGSASVVADSADNGSTDACGVASFSLAQTTYNCSDLGANNIQFTATDVNGNSSSIQVVITVLDTISPNPIAQDLTIYLDNSGSAQISSSQVDNGTSDNCGFTLSLSDSLFNCGDTGVNSIQLIAVDQSGNSAIDLANITVLDTISPTLSLVQPMVFLDANGQGSVTQADIDIGSTDNCSIGPLMISQSSFDCSEVGVVTIQVSALDPSGNISTQSLDVTVGDTISPSITCPADISVNNDLDTCGALVSISLPLNSDNCAVLSFSNDYTSGPDATGFYPVGITDVVYTIDDVNGNQSSCSFQVEVIDDQVPGQALAGNDAIVCKPDYIMDATAPSNGVGSWSLASGAGNITDPLDPKTTVDQLGLGTNLFVWTVPGPCTTNRDTVSVELVLLTVEAGNDTTVLDGEILQLNATTNIGDNGDYSWSPDLGLDNPSIPDPILTAIQTTSYVVTFTDNTGCSNEDSILVTVSEVKLVDPIGGFSPDNDGINDYWRIRGINDFPDNKVTVYNRWGNLVYSQQGYNNLDKIFDGTANQSGSWGSGELPEGTYYYTIDLGNGGEPISGYVVLKR